jgi:cob(I)alamin adenosyltransferase
VSETENNPPVSTGRGDDGTTTLLGGGRMPKSDARIIVLGDVDEASSFLGLARAEAHYSGGNMDIHDLILELQRLLYRIMGDVAMPREENMVGGGDVARLDEALEDWRSKTELPKEFVVPGESRLGALLDVSRSVVRRAERSLVAAGYGEDHPDALKAINRLSDLLFIVARGADGTYALSKGR